MKKTHGTLTDGMQLPFIIFSSLWEQVLSLLFLPLVLSCSFFEVASLLYTVVLILFWGKYDGKRISVLFQIRFFPSFCLNKVFVKLTLLCTVGEKKTLLFSQFCWKLGDRYSSAQSSIFFLLSLYYGLRDHTLSLCEYGSYHLPTCTCLLFLLKKKEKEIKNWVIEDQQRVGLRCLHGLGGHFENMPSPLACLIAMFNEHPNILKWHFLNKFLS